ncbi:hypothetical protein AN189_09245 [Loktanella sp. 3ANDIMAR09]|uniref:hypothetical protein n=1 Tax=Loktanella sp. 3ANDIMAR09 TaxID=1225657 RepID=UPI0006F890E8|nr:hypothetical protein [Loktanella sp. 3ANDIMAR09]KQI68494.1 hypothetical protein AN189_09245 [Loktanella sp. 3ANDIMAR09]
MTLFRCVALSAICLVAACGGGGGGGTTEAAAAAGAAAGTTASKAADTTKTATAVKSYTLLRNEGATLFAAYEDQLNSDRFTDPGDLPGSGTATFDGVAGYVVGAGQSLSEEALIANPDYLSRVDLAIDFGADRITGSFDGFVDARTQKEIKGALDIDARINRSADLTSEVSVTGSAAGRISGSGLNGDVSLDLNGDFLSDGAALSGRLEGTGQTSDGLRNVQGAFIATD